MALTARRNGTELMLLGTQRINEQGHLEIGGCDTVELAAQFGTPLYVVDEAAFRATARRYRQAFETRYPNSQVCFAGKALMTMAICRLAEEEGLGLDVASAGELHTALLAGFPVEHMQLHGNYKTLQELEMGITRKVGRIVIDSLEEIETLQDIAASQGTYADVLLRVTPGVTADTHYHIQTGKMDTKFGFSMTGGAALDAARRIAEKPNLRWHGIHCHIGSQILELEPFRETARLMVDAAADISDATGLPIEDIDVGGGLGVRYLPEHHPPAVEDFAEVLISSVEKRCRERDLPLPRLLLEPGRSLSGEAGTTLYTIGVIKEIPGLRTYVSVDGGLSDNPRPALYGARYSAIVANKATFPRVHKVTVSGRHCETDTLIVDVHVPEVAAGDILAVQTTGAYNYAMASNYNRFTKPAMVLVAGGTADLIVAREELDDLVRYDRMPERLRQK